MDNTVKSGGPFATDVKEEKLEFDEQGEGMLDIDKLEDRDLASKTKGVLAFQKKVLDFRNLTATAIASADEALEDTRLRESSPR